MIPVEMWQHVFSFMTWPGAAAPVCRAARSAYQEFAEQRIKEWREYSIVTALVKGRQPTQALLCLSVRMKTQDMHELGKSILLRQKFNDQHLIRFFKLLIASPATHSSQLFVNRFPVGGQQLSPWPLIPKLTEDLRENAKKVARWIDEYSPLIGRHLNSLSSDDPCCQIENSPDAPVELQILKNRSCSLL